MLIASMSIRQFTNVNCVDVNKTIYLYFNSETPASELQEIRDEMFAH